MLIFIVYMMARLSAANMWFEWHDLLFEKEERENTHMTIKLLGILKSDKRSMSVCLLRITFGTRFVFFFCCRYRHCCCCCGGHSNRLQIRVNHRYTIIPPLWCESVFADQFPILHTPLSLNKHQSMLKYTRTLSIYM